MQFNYVKSTDGRNCALNYGRATETLLASIILSLILAVYGVDDGWLKVGEIIREKKLGWSKTRKKGRERQRINISNKVVDDSFFEYIF